jgi:hypothetical protein
MVTMQTNPDRAAARDAKERRSHRRDAVRERAMSRSPQGEKLIRAMSDDLDSINEYGHGGERTRDLASLLSGAVDNGIFLYQRRLGLRSTSDPIDLIAVTPSGVWVVDIQSCAGGRVEVGGRHGMIRGRYTHLIIRGRDRTAYLDRLTGQAQAVEETLAELDRPDVPVHGAFCFYDADIRWRRTPEVGQAVLTTPRRLSSLLRRSPRVMSDIEVSAIAQALGQRLPRQQVRD